MRRASLLRLITPEQVRFTGGQSVSFITVIRACVLSPLTVFSLYSNMLCVCAGSVEEPIGSSSEKELQEEGRRGVAALVNEGG